MNQLPHHLYFVGWISLQKSHFDKGKFLIDDQDFQS